MPIDPSPRPEDGHFDIAVIGAGVVGCAVARAFAREGARVAVIERGPDILSGASRANSAILHTGFDAPADSLELELVKEGRAEYLAIRDGLNLPLVETGALVCAWSVAEAARLEDIAAAAHANGIDDVRLLAAEEVRRRLPGLGPGLCGAVEVPGENVIDPWSAPLGYLGEAIGLGARLFRDCEVIAGEFGAGPGGFWELRTSRGRLHAAAVVNAAGLYGDRVDACLGLPCSFTIRPRKGQFVVLDKAARRHVPTILLPVPTEITKGVVVCPTAFGNVLVGPTAEEQEDRTRASVERTILQGLLDHAARIVPALAEMPVTAVYAGLRPATEAKQYRVACHAGQGAITLGGIRSTGLSAALGLARHAVRLHARFGGGFVAPAAVAPPRMPNLCEDRPRPWQGAHHGGIVCHCELVTRGEIEAALAGPVPPGDFAGLRRRTRAGMGRCQGFHCNATLAAMTRGRFATPLAVGPTDAETIAEDAP